MSWRAYACSLIGGTIAPWCWCTGCELPHGHRGRHRRHHALPALGLCGAGRSWAGVCWPDGLPSHDEMQRGEGRVLWESPRSICWRLWLPITTFSAIFLHSFCVRQRGTTCAAFILLKICTKMSNYRCEKLPNFMKRCQRRRYHIFTKLECHDSSVLHAVFGQRERRTLLSLP